MKTKIDYRKEYQRLNDAAERELKEALEKFPEGEYFFVTEESDDDEYSDDWTWKAPIVGIEDICSGGDVKFIYVTSIAIWNDRIEIWGVENGEDLSYQSRHFAEELLNGYLFTLIECLPNPQ